MTGTQAFVRGPDDDPNIYYSTASAAVPRRKRINRTHVRRQRFADALGRFTWSVSAQRTNDASHQCMYYGRQSKAAKSVLAFTKVFENRRLGDDHLSPGTRRIPLAKTALPSSKRNGNTESPDESRLVTRVEHAVQMFTDRDLTNAIYIHYEFASLRFKTARTFRPIFELFRQFFTEIPIGKRAYSRL